MTTAQEIDDVLGGFDMDGKSEYGSRPWFVPGVYRCLVQAVRVGRGGEAKSGFVAFEVQILEATRTETKLTGYKDVPDGTPFDPLAVGTEAVAVVGLAGRQALVAPKLLKNYVGAISGLTGANISNGVLKKLADDRDGAMPGGPAGHFKVEVLIHAFSSPKKDKEVITKLNWKPIPGHTLMDKVKASQQQQAA